MTVRTTNLGGTDWTDGEVLYAADQNDTIKAVVGLVPIGSVIAWLKSYPNTPTLDPHFVECNGQTLSDSESPYNGQVIPNLNGNANILYGKTNSGDSRTEDFLPVHKHGLLVQSNSAANLAYEAGTGSTNTNVCNNSGAQGTAFVGYSVVWIMRIK